MSRWFRWYEGTTEDGKFRVVSRMSRVTVRDVIALWAFMLEDAAHLSHRGVCNRDEDFMSAILDFEEGVVESILEAMQNVGMISVGAGAITICNFSKRQFDGDTDPTAAERQRRKRERDSRVNNGSVTRDSRPPDTETEAETEKKDISTEKKSEPVGFEQFWIACPRRVGKGQAIKAYTTALKKPGITADILMAGIIRYQRETAGKDPQYIRHPATWLNGEGWNDEPSRPRASGPPKVTPIGVGG